MPKERINEQIKVREVRLIGADGVQVGVVDINRALAEAEKAGKDLVEISPSAKPPVCRILEFGKYYYEKVRKVREAKKRQHIVQIKEIKYGPSTEEHDYLFKRKNGLKFLMQHNKVKFTVRFRGRQMAHKDLGYNLLDRIKDDLAMYADVDSLPKAERNYISMILAPKKEIDKILEEQNSQEIEEARQQIALEEEQGVELDQDMDMDDDFDQDDDDYDDIDADEDSVEEQPKPAKKGKPAKAKKDKAKSSNGLGIDPNEI